MTTLHIHLGNKKIQKDCLGIIGDMPGAMFTSGKYLSQLPNSSVMMQRILDAEIFGLVIEKGMDQAACSILLEVIQKREEGGKKTVVITSKGNHIPKERFPFLAGNSTECFSAEDCVRVLDGFLVEKEEVY